MLNTQDSSTVLQVCFTAINLQFLVYESTEQKACGSDLLFGYLEMMHLMVFWKTVFTPYSDVLHCQVHI